MPTRLTSTPLRSPPARPTASAAARAAGTGQPCTKSAAATTPASEAIAPTDRSKSPITITTVIVAATTASMLTCWLMLSQLRAVRKVSGSADGEEEHDRDHARKAREAADGTRHAAAAPLS
jgi:hypothetical protein